MAKLNDKDKNYLKFVKSMDHLYESVYRFNLGDFNFFTAEHFKKLASRCDNLANEFDRIFYETEGARNS